MTTIGRRTAVTLSESIDELPGYDPVSAAVIERLAGRTFLFPRGLTVRELQDRLATRRKADYGVGYVDVEVGSELVWATIRTVVVTVVAVKPSGEPVRPVPAHSGTIETGDRLYLAA